VSARPFLGASASDGRPIPHHSPMPTDVAAPVDAAASATVPAAAAEPIDLTADPAAEPLRRNRDFRAFVSAEGISALGDSVSFTALPLLVLALTGSGLAMGVVGALQTLPDLVFGLMAGAVADRSDQKRMMVLSDLGRAILTALIPLSVVLNGPTMAVILIVAAPMSTLRSLFLAAYTAAVPAIVGRPRLAQANSYFEVVYSTGFIIGPAIAGVLATAIGPGPTMAIDAASFVFAAIGIALIKRPLRAPGDRPESHYLADIREGISFIVRHPVLRATILFWSLTSVVSAGLVTALTVRITRDLGRRPDDFGLVLAAFGVGTVAGALWASRLRHGPAWPQILGGNLVRGVALVVVAMVASVELMAALSFVAGVSSTLVLIAYITLRSAYAPDELLGRVGSTARTLSLGMQPIGMLATGALIDATSGGTALMVIGVLLAAASFLFAPSRGLRAASLEGR
jgi:predicted MFS family arabinose efflux permease